MASKIVKINRAPVMTLWATVVAERLGHAPETALTLGRAVAGLNAQSKARRLGLVEEREPEEAPTKPARKPQTATILGRAVPMKRTRDGLRATANAEAIQPETVKRYLGSKFGEDLAAVRAAMEALAAAYSPDELAEQAYALYERFRPTVPEGERGWGAAGNLDVTRIRRMARRGRR
jgi:hypothetical protein